MKNKLIYVTAPLLIASAVLAQKQEVICNDNKTRLSVEVSKTGLSALSMKGDRIKEVLGLDAAIAVEKDEANGQLYLNGVTGKQNITILSEGGEMQDMELVPSSRGSTRIILKTKADDDSASSSPHQTHAFERSPFVSSSDRPTTFNKQDALIAIMKSLNLGAGVPDTKAMIRKTKTGFEMVPDRYFSHMGMRGEAFTVTNQLDNPMQIVEKDFYETGDLAISSSKRSVKPGESFQLFVVRLA